MQKDLVFGREIKSHLLRDLLPYGLIRYAVGNFVNNLAD